MIAPVLIQIVFNILNAYIDAYRILKNKTIAHGINLGCYGLLVTAECIYFKFNWVIIILLCIEAFLNRQNTFDIPLNLRRRKNNKTITWDHMSQDKPPKAWWDRQEYKIFGNNGRKMAITYIILWIISLGALFGVYYNS